MDDQPHTLDNTIPPSAVLQYLKPFIARYWKNVTIADYGYIVRYPNGSNAHWADLHLGHNRLLRISIYPTQSTVAYGHVELYVNIFANIHTLVNPHSYNTTEEERGIRLQLDFFATPDPHTNPAARQFTVWLERLQEIHQHLTLTPNNRYSRTDFPKVPWRPYIRARQKHVPVTP